MIIGVGHDVVDVTRIQNGLAKYGDRFRQRVFTHAEQSYADNAAHKAHAYAKRFAAKEAVAKALGTGVKSLGAGAQTGLALRDIEIVKNPSGQPAIALHGTAKNMLRGLCPSGHAAFIHLALSDERDMASAFVVVEMRPEKKS